MEKSISLVTFNCLSPNLSSPKQFLNYNSKHLEGRKRYEKIIGQFESWIQEKKIILLQEVSLKWKGAFEKFFVNQNYYFFSANYGSNFSGNMGIAICVPAESYQVKMIEYKRIGEIVRKVVTPNRTDEWMEYATNLFYKYGKKIPYLEKYIREEDHVLSPSSISKMASQRQNQAIYLELMEKETDKSFMVINYHMPCCFNTPDVQLLHVYYLFKHYLDSYGSKELPVVFGGDFNIKPSSYIYEYITEGNIPENILDLIPYNDSNDLGDYVSAYKDKHGSEAEFTNWSESIRGGVFKETLDYFFVSKNVTVQDVSLGIKVEEKCPNSECPSDHIPILMNISI